MYERVTNVQNIIEEKDNEITNDFKTCIEDIAAEK